MGFTQPKRELFAASGVMRQANEHIEDFIEAVHVPVLQALVDARAGGSAPRTSTEAEVGAR